MKIVQPSAVVHWTMTGEEMLAAIERAGRVAYKSEGKIGPGTAEPFVKMLLARGHESVLEHASVSATVVCDRGVSHEIVRHRIASYTQESTRFCNYSNARFGREIKVICPSWAREPDVPDRVYAEWLAAMRSAEGSYLAMLDAGASPQTARSVLPNSLKTELVMTMNLREWRHFFSLRCAPAAHPDMRMVANALWVQFAERLPVLFPCEVSR